MLCVQTGPALGPAPGSASGGSGTFVLCGRGRLCRSIAGKAGCQLVPRVIGRVGCIGGGVGLAEEAPERCVLRTIGIPLGVLAKLGRQLVFIMVGRRDVFVHGPSGQSRVQNVVSGA